MTDANNQDDYDYEDFGELPAEMQELLDKFVRTLVGQIDMEIAEKCVTAVKDGDIALINDRHINMDDVNISERLLITYCRAMIEIEKRTIQ